MQKNLHDDTLKAQNHGFLTPSHMAQTWQSQSGNQLGNKSTYYKRVHKIKSHFWCVFTNENEL